MYECLRLGKKLMNGFTLKMTHLFHSKRRSSETKVSIVWKQLKFVKELKKSVIEMQTATLVIQYDRQFFLQVTRHS